MYAVVMVHVFHQINVFVNQDTMVKIVKHLTVIMFYSTQPMFVHQTEHVFHQILVNVNQDITDILVIIQLQ